MSLTSRLRAAQEQRSSDLDVRPEHESRAPRPLPAGVAAAMSRVLDRERPGYLANVAAAGAYRRPGVELGSETAGGLPGNSHPGAEPAPEPIRLPTADERAPRAVPEPGAGTVECVACRGKVVISRVDLVAEVLQGSCASCGLQTTRHIAADSLRAMRVVVDEAIESEASGGVLRRLTSRSAS